MKTKSEVSGLWRSDNSPPFQPIEPPFNFNAPNVATVAPEVSGNYLLQRLRERLGWESFADRKLLDFGCGVRFTRTIYNLDIPIGLYAGVDIHREAIAWMQEHVRDARFGFWQLDAKNAMYNPEGSETLGEDALASAGVPQCDAACMFSVITHQSPPEALLTFRMLRRVVRTGGQLYFTAFLDRDASSYFEQDPDNPGHKSTYPPAELADLVVSAGWKVTAIFEKSRLQQQAFLCEAI